MRPPPKKKTAFLTPTPYTNYSRELKFGIDVCQASTFGANEGISDFFILSQDKVEKMEKIIFLQYFSLKQKLKNLFMGPKIFHCPTFEPNMDPLPYPVWAVEGVEKLGDHLLL